MDWWAAGTELVAVTVGVLVALWVNNWNERRLARRRERSYLDSLRDDFATDVAKLKTQVEFAQGTAEAATELLRMLRRGTISELPTNTLLRMLKRAGMMYPFRPTTTTFQELSGGGNLGLVRDRNVLRAVIDYYDQTEFSVASSKVAIKRIWYEYYDALSSVIDPVLIPSMTRDVFDLLRAGTPALERGESGSRPMPDLGLEAGRIDIAALGESKELDRALSLVLDSAVLVSEGHRDLLAQAESIVALLDHGAQATTGST